MSLKLKLDSLDGVDKNLHALYEEKEGKYYLKVEGLEDTSALKRAKDHEKEARKKAEQQLKAIQDELKTLKDQIEANKDDDAKKKGDIEALEKSWKEKLEKREAELQTRLDEMSNGTRTLLVDKEAVRIASELAVEGSADVLVPHIKSRLGVEQKDGQFVTVVNDAEGKPSALTLDELKKEIAGNAAFAPVIVGSKATGGGAGGGKPGSTEVSSESSQVTKSYMSQLRGQ